MSYDKDNIFAKILRGDIPCKKAYEEERVLAFYDINPQAPVHILVIPKGHYTDMTDFTTNASAIEISDFFRAIGAIVQIEGLDKSGYRVINNCGINGGQEVPHVHLHILGGKKLGRMVQAE